MASKRWISLAWQDSLSSDGPSMRTMMTGSLDVELAGSRDVHCVRTQDVRTH